MERTEIFSLTPGIRRYVHLGTGNYNDSTAKLYTDCGIFTCKESIGEDATAVFNMLSGYSEPLAWNELVLAPYWLRDKFLRLIGRETKNAQQGREARIVAKMNSHSLPEFRRADSRFRARSDQSLHRLQMPHTVPQ